MEIVGELNGEPLARGSLENISLRNENTQTIAICNIWRSPNVLCYIVFVVITFALVPCPYVKLNGQQNIET